jgi:hypothetical protein
MAEKQYFRYSNKIAIKADATEESLIGIARVLNFVKGSSSAVGLL